MNENGERKIILGTGEGSVTEKKSRFIAHCFEIHSEEEAQNFINETKKEYWDAKHNCFAYVLGSNSEIQRFSDDKEPGGTAGKPILECLLSNNISNSLIIVTRYFGGVLLGRGGLVRAYSDAAMEGIKNCCVSKIYSGCKIEITCDYELLSKLQFVMEKLSETSVLLTEKVEYLENVSFLLCAEDTAAATLQKKITEISSGTAKFEKGKAVSFAEKDGLPVYLDE